MKSNSKRPVIGSNYFPKKSYKNDDLYYSELNPRHDTDAIRLQNALLHGGFIERNKEMLDAIVGCAALVGFLAFIMHLPEIAAAVGAFAG